MLVGSHVINELAFEGLTEAEARTMLTPFSESVQNRIIEALKKGGHLKEEIPEEKPKKRPRKKKSEEGGE